MGSGRLQSQYSCRSRSASTSGYKSALRGGRYFRGISSDGTLAIGTSAASGFGETRLLESFSPPRSLVSEFTHAVPVAIRLPMLPSPPPPRSTGAPDGWPPEQQATTRFEFAQTATGSLPWLKLATRLQWGRGTARTQSPHLWDQAASAGGFKPRLRWFRARRATMPSRPARRCILEDRQLSPRPLPLLKRPGLRKQDLIAQAFKRHPSGTWRLG